MGKQTQVKNNAQGEGVICVWPFIKLLFTPNGKLGLPSDTDPSWEKFQSDPRVQATRDGPLSTKAAWEELPAFPLYCIRALSRAAEGTGSGSREP